MHEGSITLRLPAEVREIEWLNRLVRTLGGLGIHLVRSLMDRVEYRRENAKNVLTMRKRIR